MPCFLLWLITIAISIASGILSCNWIELDGFFEAIIFIIIWRALSLIGHFMTMMLIALLAGMD